MSLREVVGYLISLETFQFSFGATRNHNFKAAMKSSLGEKWWTSEDFLNLWVLMQKQAQSATLLNRRPTHVPLLTVPYKVLHLAWARQHGRWTVDDWNHVAWSDKSRIQLNRADGRVRVWRQPQESMDPTCQQGTVQAGGSLMMVWGVCSCRDMGPLDTSRYDSDRFVEWDQNEIAIVPDFHKRILFSDEGHFWLNGYVNKQSCRIWSDANPQVYVETPLHQEKLVVWCVLWAGGIIGPYFFKNNEGHNVTVNGDRYRAMITNFFIPELNNHDVQELWFQQDGATCHTARATIELLKDKFGDHLISRFGPVNWPPRSCDLTPLDYFLCGYVKSLVYAD
ncbi:putative DD41D transposase [Trichonephila clavipes]|nr:putative DD41D transposase [Trichonephila clavipes]